VIRQQAIRNLLITRIAQTIDYERPLGRISLCGGLSCYSFERD